MIAVIPNTAQNYCFFFKYGSNYVIFFFFLFYF